MEYNNKGIRRQDRTLDEGRALEILEQGEYGVLSMQTEDRAEAYGIPLSYAWDHRQSIYIHCAPEGRKLRCLDACSQVSFCIVGRTHVLPEKFTTGYESIVLRCTAHHHLSPEERRLGLEVFIKKYCPDHLEQGFANIEKSFHRTELIRLDIWSVSGKTKKI